MYHRNCFKYAFDCCTCTVMCLTFNIDTIVYMCIHLYWELVFLWFWHNLNNYFLNIISIIFYLFRKHSEVTFRECLMLISFMSLKSHWLSTWKSFGNHSEVNWKSLGSLEITRKSIGNHSEVIWKSFGSQLELSSNFIRNQFGIHMEICSNIPNAHSEIPNKVFRVIHSEISSASWNFYTRVIHDIRCLENIKCTLIYI
jgi:hypothetical protein